MPSALLCFRSVCGQFVSIFVDFMLARTQFKPAIRTLTLRKHADGAIAGMILSLFCFGHLLLLSGDIELNPGPPKTSRQTRLTSAEHVNRHNTSRAQPESVPTAPEPTIQDVMSVLLSMTDSLNQTCDSISECDATVKSRTTAKSTTKNITKAEESTTNDMMSLLHDINNKFDDLKQNVLQLTNVCSQIQSDISNLKQEISELKQENEEMKNINSSLQEKVETLERKADRLDRQTKQNNIIVYGVPRKNKENKSECEQSVRELLTDKMKLPEDISLEDVHRINNKPDSPIFIRFSFHKQRQIVLRNRYKLRGTGTFISEDFPLAVREIRKKLVPFLKDAKKTGKKATLIYDHILIDGQQFYLSENELKMKE